jgi:hypothetical protein
MSHKNKVQDLWSVISNQNWDEIHNYFHKDAAIYWPNTNEKFAVEGFMKANSYYPGNWSISVCRLEEVGNIVISVALVTLEDSDISLYVTSFFTFQDGLIIELSEYWSDNNEPPQWRKDLKIAQNIIE